MNQVILEVTYVDGRTVSHTFNTHRQAYAKLRELKLNPNFKSSVVYKVTADEDITERPN